MTALLPRIGWATAIALAVGAAIWPLAHPERIDALFAGDLAKDERRAALLVVALTLSLALFGYATAVLVDRFRRGTWAPARVVEAVNRSLVWVLAAPLVVGLAVEKIETKHVVLTLTLIAGAAALAGGSFYWWPRRSTSKPMGRAWRIAGWALAIVAVSGLWLAYGSWFSVASVINHQAMHTQIADLGYYDNIFFHSSRGAPLVCTLCKEGVHYSSHFDPILVLISPLYRLYPRAEFALYLQSFWLGSGAIPLFLLARRRLGHALPAVALALCFVLYPAMQGMNLYDFHSIALIAPLVLWLLYAFECDSPIPFGFIFVLLLLTREDVSLLMCFIAAGMFMTRTGRWRWISVAMILVSVIYFVVVKKLVMISPDVLNCTKGGTCFRYYYEDLIPKGEGVGGLLTSLITAPVYALKIVLDQDKLVFFAQLFLPMAFVPFFVKRRRVMLVYGMAFCFLASNEPVYSLGFQYSSFLYPIGFALTAIGLDEIRRSHRLAALGFDPARMSNALVGVVLVASMLSSWKFGGLIENGAFRGGFGRPARELSSKDADRYAWLTMKIASIPEDAPVAATRRIGPHISNRPVADYYPRHTNDRVDYVFVHMPDLKSKERKRLDREVKAGKYVELDRQGQIRLYGRPDGSTRSAPKPVPDRPMQLFAPGTTVPPAKAKRRP